MDCSYKKRILKKYQFDKKSFIRVYYLFIFRIIYRDFFLQDQLKFLYIVLYREFHIFRKRQKLLYVKVEKKISREINIYSRSRQKSEESHEITALQSKFPRQSALSVHRTLRMQTSYVWRTSWNHELYRAIISTAKRIIIIIVCRIILTGRRETASVAPCNSNLHQEISSLLRYLMIKFAVKLSCTSLPLNFIFTKVGKVVVHRFLRNGIIFINIVKMFSPFDIPFTLQKIISSNE